MIRINLLPHRAEKRRARQIQFVALSVISLLLAALVIGVVHVGIAANISYQEGRNNYLKREIAKLDEQLKDIEKLRKDNESLLSRKKVVEDLQSTRADVVHLIDQMLRILPDGVYLKSLKQTGNQISLNGYAQSNARVSSLMRAIEDSRWLDTRLDTPTLGEVHAVTVGGARVSEFSLTFNLTKIKDDKKDAVATPAGPKRTVP